MKAVADKIPAFLLNRSARNIWFWIYMYVSKIVPKHSLLSGNLYYGLVAFNLLFFAIPCYINNFLLIPRLLSSKRYISYSIAFLANVIVFTVSYTWWLKYLQVKILGIRIFDVSIEAPLLTSDLSWRSVIEESRSPFWIFFIFIFSFTGLWYIQDHTRNERIAREAVKKQVELELSFLKQQVNPHFLFNTLNNLYGLTLVKSDRASEAILKLSSVMRYILYEASVELISFEKEKEIIQAYIDIEMLRLSEHSDVQFSIMNTQEKSIPPLLWLPVLENAFKHGAHTLSDDFSIDFRFTLKDDLLSIYSRNTCHTARKRDPAKPGGIGLSNLGKRLGLLYPGKHSIFTGIDDDNFYVVNVKIELA